MTRLWNKGLGVVSGAPFSQSATDPYRRIMRAVKRAEKHAAYAKNGLNGPRAMLRRFNQTERQIARVLNRRYSDA